MKKLSLLFALPLVLSMALVGCGTSSNNNAANQGAASKTLLDQIKADGTIKIGTEGTYAPFTFHDKSGALTGFDVDIANEVAKRLGVKPQYVETKWDGMFAGLDDKRFDMIANEVAPTPDRQQKYDFSSPYILSKPVLIVRNDNTTIKTFADLKGKKSAQSLTSNLTKIAKSNGATIVPTDGFNQAIDLLTSGRVDATVNDGLSFLDLKKNRPDVPLKVVDTAPQGTPSALMFRKGNPELVAAVNKALGDMEKDGTYLKISKKWFGTDVSK